MKVRTPLSLGAGALAPLLFATTAHAATWVSVASWPVGTKNKVTVIPDGPGLDPGKRDFRLTVSLKTSKAPTRPDWDLIRKGYSDGSDSLYKVEYWPDGRASCTLAGTRGSAFVMAGPDLSDGDWHTVTCQKTTRTVSLIIDGEAVAVQRKTVGSITNRDAVIIGAHNTSGRSELFLGKLKNASFEVADTSTDTTSSTTTAGL